MAYANSAGLDAGDANTRIERSSCEQLGAGLCELHICAALVEPQLIAKSLAAAEAHDQAALIGSSDNLRPSTFKALLTVSMVGFPPGRNDL